MKRLFDVVCAGLGLLVLLPFGIIIGALIKFADGGPIFFAQTRIGRFGKPFRIWKFRSMVVNAERLGVSLTKEEDPRITGIGRFLRKSKLDELPQLWNVLIGEMSFVGPRPEVPRYVERYTAQQRQILDFKPGITDMATMLFRNEEALLRGAADVEVFYVRHCLPKKIELNLQYAKQATWLHDVWIILQTLIPYWVGVLTLYAGALTGSFWFAYELRADFEMKPADWKEFRHCLPWILFPQLLLLVLRGQVRGLMSYFSIPEMRRTAAALGLALLMQVGICYLSQGRVAPTRNILLMDFVLSFFALCGVRMGFRLLREKSSALQSTTPVQPWRVAIIGTGQRATNLALDFSRSEQRDRRVVAFFDDNPRTWHKRPHDIPVVGMPECLLNPEWLDKIDEIIVAVSDENPQRLNELNELLGELPLKVTFASDWLVLKGVTV